MRSRGEGWQHAVILGAKLQGMDAFGFPADRVDPELEFRHPVDQRLVRQRRELDRDGIARRTSPPFRTMLSDACAADEAGRLRLHDVFQQAGLKRLDLVARIAQPGQLDLRLRAEAKAGARRQSQQVDVARRYVLAEIAQGGPCVLFSDNSSNSSAWIRWTCRRFGRWPNRSMW